MKRNSRRKKILDRNIRRTIGKSLGRFLAIVGIIALGAGMFVGLLSTKSDMIATAQDYLDEQNMFDLRLISSYGWSKDDVRRIAALSGVMDAEGSITVDAFAQLGNGDASTVYRLHAIPNAVNKVYLLEGRMPEKSNECLLDGNYADKSFIGRKFTISEKNEASVLDGFSEHTYTVVGLINSPLYMDIFRGSTTIGSGSLTGFAYVMPEVFTQDYFTEIYVTISGDRQVYTDAFAQAMERMAQQIQGDAQVIAQDRMLQLKADGQVEYENGLAEYENGFAEYEKAKQEALDELDHALAELESGQAQWDKNWAQILDGEAQIADAKKQLDDAARQLSDGRAQLLQAKADAYKQIAQAHSELTKNYKDVITGLAQVEDGLAQIDEGIPQIEDGLGQLSEGISQLDFLIGIQKSALDLTNNLLEVAKLAPTLNRFYIKQLEAQLKEQQAAYDESLSQRQELLDMQTQYTGQLEELKATREELKNTKKTLTDARVQIEAGFAELDNQKVLAEQQFAASEAELNTAQQELDAGRKELETKKAELAEGRVALEEAKAELNQGWADYAKGKAEAEEEFTKAEAELLDAKSQLDDAAKQLENMKSANVYILDRNTNQGYVAVNHNSDIVAGVSRVFPAFFLLVAALVCITTMTRMVEEERTQIGILKALGYSNGGIIKKYLVYSGSAALLGCGLGTLIGSVVFPIILWKAYGIILTVRPDIVLQLNWPLCLAVVAAYTAVSSLVTWYCCRRELREVPAELIRPRAPQAGKKIFLEYLPFWNKIGFLNKVMFRNVFRYRQRLLMMLIGICGCTALLLTGFGLRDSIMHIVDNQFENITFYDMQVYFAGGQTEQEQSDFRERVGADATSIHFFHQSSMDLCFEDETKNVYMIVSDESIKDYIHFNRDGKSLTMPGLNEVYITISAAQNMGIQVGDTVTLRDGDMRALQLTVAGIFDNHVQNYAVVSPQTVQKQWDYEPQKQMAVLMIDDFADIHQVGAAISNMSDVINVSISEDTATQVKKMMQALDLVVITVVVCAGALAVIVLYNLTNISITERIREIATIKVLGFNARETAMYVFKENLLLTVMSTALGLGGGVLLLDFVMSQIKVDMVWMFASLTPLSYLWAILLTILSAVFVDFLLYFKLEKINMAEALKSVE